MSYVGLALCLTLLAYGVAVCAGSALALPFFPRTLRIEDPGTRARRLLALRLLPPALALVLALGIVLPAFLWHEPRGTVERVGPGLLLAALLAGALVVAGIVRCATGVLATRRLVRRWRRTARPIRLTGVPLPAFAVDETFPIVAVAGCMRPTLFVSERVLSECTTGELAAIAAHELGHLRRRDPWSRLLLRACPDVLACTSLGAVLERSWTQAAEQAADDHAADSLELASALLVVAHLARDAAAPGWVPWIALHRGGGVARRIERLLEARAPRAARPRHRRGVIAALTLAASVALVSVAASPPMLRGVHSVIESVVNRAW